MVCAVQCGFTTKMKPWLIWLTHVCLDVWTIFAQAHGTGSVQQLYFRMICHLCPLWKFFPRQNWLMSLLTMINFFAPWNYHNRIKKRKEKDSEVPSTLHYLSRIWQALASPCASRLPILQLLSPAWDPMVQYGDPADSIPLIHMEGTYHTPLEFHYQSLSYHQPHCDVVVGRDLAVVTCGIIEFSAA